MNQLVLEGGIVGALSDAIVQRTLSRYDTPFAMDLIETLCGDVQLGATWDQVQPSARAYVFLLAERADYLVQRACEYLMSLVQRFDEASLVLIAAGLPDALSSVLRYALRN